MPRGRSENHTPPLGDEYPDANRTCVRLMGHNEDGSERLCGTPASYHVDWGPALAFVCEAHAAEARERDWEVQAYHDLGPCCGMPGALWDYQQNVCRYGEDGLPTIEEPVRAVAVVS